MKYYLIDGTQQDGDHEYRIQTIIESEREPIWEEGFIALVIEHSFEYNEDDYAFNIEMDDINCEDSTLIQYTGQERISYEHAKVLSKLTNMYVHDIKDLENKLVGKAR